MRRLGIGSRNLFVACSALGHSFPTNGSYPYISPQRKKITVLDLAVNHHSGIR